MMASALRLSAIALALAALPAHAMPARAQARPAFRPNVVVFVADDLGWRDLGIYGNAAIRTPNIDRLARSGLRVVRAFGTTPQCSPSRISTLTGKYAHATGTEDLHTPLPAGERILPSYLQAEGSRARIELYDLARDPWELRNIADDPAYAGEVRDLAEVLQEWVEQSGDFPAAYRVRDDNTDRITGVPFTTNIPPLRNADVPPPTERWGRKGPT
jgi:arylsulfatase A-like enzyme